MTLPLHFFLPQHCTLKLKILDVKILRESLESWMQEMIIHWQNLWTLEASALNLLISLLA